MLPGPSLLAKARRQVAKMAPNTPIAPGGRLLCLSSKAVRPILVAWLLLILSITGCGGETAVPARASRVDRSVGARLAGDEPITATITLRGFAREDCVDADGRCVVTSGLENVAVGSYVLLDGGGSAIGRDAIAGYMWTLQAPGGSGAALDHSSSSSPVFVPDVSGDYTVTLTVANRQGEWGPAASLTVHAGTWVGWGIDDQVTANPPHCIACHADRVQAWAGTRHASCFERAIDGNLGEHYVDRCNACHTLGYDRNAASAGFDDVARDVEWALPETLVAGNWDSLATRVSRLANLANVQCENCHGPGSEHGGRREGIALSLRTEVCDVCHDPLRQFRAAQWVASAHDDVGFAVPSLSPSGGELCWRCHLGQGLIDYVDGKAVVGGGLQRVTCAVCHDPHDATHEHQLRVFDAVILPGGRQVTDVGPSALCMMCHNGGVSSEQVYGDEPILPHGSTAAEMMAGAGGYDYGQNIEDSAHLVVIPGCVGCHMAPTLGMDDRGTPDDVGDDVPLRGHSRVGEHTFRMAWNGGTPDDLTDDVENVAVCRDCHAELSTFNRTAKGDYDGDGDTEGIQEEVWGLLELVRAEILAQGVQWQGETPVWSTVTTEAQRGAIYNLSFVLCDGSLGVHNAGRAVRLLQLAYRHLTGQDVPGAAQL
jgi:hypothetical protein